MEIEGKVALVLGAARGIGKAVGFALAEAGARVIMTYYDWPDESAAMVEELAGLGPEHMAVRVDLRDSGQVEALFEKIDAKYSSLDILINNIERGGMPVVHGTYDRAVNCDQWELELATTLKAKYLVFRRALPLLKNVAQAAVVNISSIAGLVGRTGPAGLLFSDGYVAANRAISSFTESWAREAAPTVRVNELMLGFFETRHCEGTRGWELLTENDKKTLYDHIPLQRSGELADIVKAVFFLVRDAEYMTGSVLRLDGGYVLGGEGVPPMPEGIL